MTKDGKQIERYRGIVKFLDNTVRNIALYPPEHPSVKGVSKRVHDYLEAIFDGKEEVLLGVVNGVLYVDDYLFYETTPYSENVLRLLTGFEIDDLLFRKGVSEAELLKLASILKLKERNRETFLRLREQEGLSHIGLKSFQLGEGEEGSPTKGLEAYRDAVSAMTGFFADIGDGRMPPLREAEKLVENFMDRRKENGSALMLLSSLKGYDAYTYQHCVNVGILALLLAEKTGAREQEVKWAALAGMMHDIGKVKIPSRIINKSGRLTPREWEVMKSHPHHSAEVVRGMGGAEELALAVEGHHMHHNGGGYPVRSERSGPSNLAQLIAVVDAYDAITTVRSYKRPMTPVEAMAFIEQNRGTLFAPCHVDAFISLVGAHPPGAIVRLSSNEIGVVLGAGEQPGRPVIKVILDEHGRPCEEEDLDLGGSRAQGRVIAAVVDPVLYGLEPGTVLSQGGI